MFFFYKAFTPTEYIRAIVGVVTNNLLSSTKQDLS
ncbi:hypothetical protein FHW89_004125 [Mucilaginibacter sp. SG564]|nr:hypothetical protein [Mucilaginibacter sp. SG564]